MQRFQEIISNKMTLIFFSTFLLIPLMFFSCNNKESGNDLIDELKWSIYLANMNCFSTLNNEIIMSYSIPLVLAKTMKTGSQKTIYKFEFIYQNKSVKFDNCSPFTLADVDKLSNELNALGADSENVIMSKDDLKQLESNYSILKSLLQSNITIDPWLKKQIESRL